MEIQNLETVAMKRFQSTHSRCIALAAKGIYNEYGYYNGIKPYSTLVTRGYKINCDTTTNTNYTSNVGYEIFHITYHNYTLHTRIPQMYVIE